MNRAVITTGAAAETQLRRFGLNPRIKSEFTTTETELKAMASPANSAINKPKAAMGMPTEL